MKLAVCLSGHPRHFKEGYEFFKPAFSGIDVDYFIHNWYDPSGVGEELIPGSNPFYHKKGWKVEADTDKDLIRLYDPKKYIFEKQIEFIPRLDFHTNMKTKQKPKNFMSMVYSRKEVGKLLQEYVKETGIEYDWVFFTRTDVAIKRFLREELEDFSNNSVLIAHVPGPDWNVSHLNDSVLASSYENMIYWSTLYDHYERYWLEGMSFCAHRLQYHHINLLGAPLRQILEPQGTGWSWIRADGLATY